LLIWRLADRCMAESPTEALHTQVGRAAGSSSRTACAVMGTRSVTRQLRTPVRTSRARKKARRSGPFVDGARRARTADLLIAKRGATTGHDVAFAALPCGVPPVLLPIQPRRMLVDACGCRWIWALERVQCPMPAREVVALHGKRNSLRRSTLMLTHAAITSLAGGAQ